MTGTFHRLPLRRGDWMPTSTGRAFWPLDPRPEEIHIEDIAAGLARMCRYGGQLRHDVEFYSVAEHSVFVALHAPAHLRLTALLHDAPEGLGLIDMIRPVKPFIPEYLVHEARLATAVGRRFGVVIHPLHPEIEHLDRCIVADERDQVMAPWPLSPPLAEPALGVRLQCWSPFRARDEFLRLFYLLGGE